MRLSEWLFLNFLMNFAESLGPAWMDGGFEASFWSHLGTQLSHSKCNDCGVKTYFCCCLCVSPVLYFLYYIYKFSCVQIINKCITLY